MWLLSLRAAGEGVYLQNFDFHMWGRHRGLVGVRRFYLGRRGQSRLEGAQFLLLFNQELETESEEKE